MIAEDDAVPPLLGSHRTEYPSGPRGSRARIFVRIGGLRKRIVGALDRVPHVGVDLVGEVF